MFSPIGINIEIPKTHRFSESKTDLNWKYCGKYSPYYYQPQHTTYNQIQHYRHCIRTQKSPSGTDYDREKVVKCGNIHSGIPSPYI